MALTDRQPSFPYDISEEERASSEAALIRKIRTTPNVAASVLAEVVVICPTCIDTVVADGTQPDLERTTTGSSLIHARKFRRLASGVLATTCFNGHEFVPPLTQVARATIETYLAQLAAKQQLTEKVMPEASVAAKLPQASTVAA